VAGAVRSPDPFRHPQFPRPVPPVPRARTAHWASTSWLVRAACHLHESRGSEHRYRAKYRWLTSICSINKVNICLNWAVPCRGNALHKVGIGMSDGTVLTRLPAGESGVRNIQCPVKGTTALGPSLHQLIYSPAISEQGRIWLFFCPGSILPPTHYRLMLRRPVVICVPAAKVAGQLNAVGRGSASRRLGAWPTGKTIGREGDRRAGQWRRRTPDRPE
jgi:hypothetical protein